MLWRIVESKRGFHAQKCAVFPEEVPLASGRIVERFVVYESARFDTKRQAEKYIERRTK